MGYFGLATDQILELDVVLADGSNIKVSASSHPDLYWGMRGAGHNFGVVTQYRYQIYPRPSADWYYSLQTFRADKLEELFNLLNDLGDNGNQPKEIVIYTVFVMNPAISTTEVCRSSCRLLTRLKISQYSSQSFSSPPTTQALPPVHILTCKPSRSSVPSPPRMALSPTLTSPTPSAPGLTVPSAKKETAVPLSPLDSGHGTFLRIEPCMTYTKEW